MECQGCGQTYAEFRSGLTFHDVYQLMLVYSDDPSQWRQKRRHCVLGYWRELKLGLFIDYHRGCV